MDTEFITITDCKYCLDVARIDNHKMLHQMNPDFLDANPESSGKTCLETCIVRPRISQRGDGNGIYSLLY